MNTRPPAFTPPTFVPPAARAGASHPPIEAAAEPFSPERWIWAAAILLLAAIGVYCTAFRADFIWDDNYFLWQNLLNEDPWGIPKMWFTRASFDYWPLTTSVFWIEWQLWGRDPLGYHAQNILLHALNGLLLWMVFRRLRLPGGWLAALIYALHPVNATSVVWITEIKNILSTTLLLLAALAYLRHERTGSRWAYWGSLALFFFALTAKSSLVGVPVLILIRQWWLSGRIDKKTLWRSAPFFAAALFMGVLTILFHHYNPTRKDICMTVPANLLDRLAGAGWAVWFYWYKTFVPVNLSMIYPQWKINTWNPLVYVPGLALAGLLVLGWRFRQSWGRGLVAAVVAFAALIFPALGFVNMSYMMHSRVADHFQYLAIAVSIAAVVGLIVPAAARLRRRPRVGLMILAGAAVIGLGVLTAQRAWILRGHIPLWRDTIARNPQAWMAYYHLGTELCLAGEQLAAQGRSAEAQTTFTEALDWLLKGAAIQPAYPSMWSNAGVAQTRLGKLNDAVESHRRAVEAEPDASQWRYNYAMALKGVGRLEEAIAPLEKVVELSTKARDGQAQVELALALAQAGGDERLARARMLFAQALELNPKNVQAALLTADLELRQKNLAEAKRWYAYALDLEPRSPAVRRAAALGMLQLGRPAEAVEHFVELEKLGTLDADTRNAYGLALAQAGRPSDALGQFEQVLRINPSHVPALTNAGQASEMVGLNQQAANLYQRALALNPDFTPAREGLRRLSAGKQ